MPRTLPKTSMLFLVSTDNNLISCLIDACTRTLTVRFSETLTTIQRDNSPKIYPYFLEDQLPATPSGIILSIRFIIKQRSHSLLVLTIGQRVQELSMKLNF